MKQITISSKMYLWEELKTVTVLWKHALHRSMVKNSVQPGLVALSTQEAEERLRKSSRSAWATKQDPVS
jgi:hypothetical protein